MTQQEKKDKKIRMKRKLEKSTQRKLGEGEYKERGRRLQLSVLECPGSLEDPSARGSSVGRPGQQRHSDLGPGSGDTGCKC